MATGEHQNFESTKEFQFTGDLWEAGKYLPLGEAGHRVPGAPGRPGEGLRSARSSLGGSGPPSLEGPASAASVEGCSGRDRSATP